MQLCFSSNFIEQQAFNIYENIKKQNNFKCVGVQLAGNEYVDLVSKEDPAILITKVYLEDETGVRYAVVPNPHGLRFANGDISYVEYQHLQKKESRKGVSLFVMAVFIPYILLSALYKLLF